MASFESSDPQKSNRKSDFNVRLISLSSEVNFDWILFDLFLKQHVSQWPNGAYCLPTDLEKVDLLTPQKKIRHQEKRNSDRPIPKSWVLYSMFLSTVTRRKRC